MKSLTSRAHLAPAALALLAVAGCNQPVSHPEPTPVPTPNAGPVLQSPEQRPLPPTAVVLDGRAPGYADAPLLNQPPPEQPAFVAAYRGVGSPKVALFVNRSFDGSVLPVDEAQTLTGRQTVRRSTAGVTVDKTSTDGGYRYGDQSTDRFQSAGPAEYRESTETYLPAGQYDEADAKRIDYAAVETILADGLAADGNITLLAPDLARARLSDQALKELKEGRPQVLREVAQQLDADVLIQVQAKPTRQTPDGLAVRLVAQAMNTSGGELIGRAVVDVPPPLTKQTINYYSRYLTRKLMDDMTRTWTNAPAPATKP